ncbi:hypothetical protein HRbin30_00381 [bacterium HR30]|nr:hypothetical protein HRbin30_00381 [bacterium HR30]
MGGNTGNLSPGARSKVDVGRRAAIGVTVVDKRRHGKMHPPKALSMVDRKALVANRQPREMVPG